MEEINYDSDQGLNDYDIGTIMFEQYKNYIVKYGDELWVYFDSRWTKDYKKIFILWIGNSTINVAKKGKPIRHLRGYTSRFYRIRKQMICRCFNTLSDDYQKRNEIINLIKNY